LEGYQDADERDREDSPHLLGVVGLTD